MKNKIEIRDWMLENCVDEDGNLDLEDLDFSNFDGDVYISWMKVKGDLHQDNQKVDGNLFQNNQEVGLNLVQDEDDDGYEIDEDY